MNAVNLIPADSRKQRPTLAASPATLGLIGGLVVLIAAAVLYVTAVNNVTQRKSELAQVTASAAGWQAAANSYSSAVASAQQRAQQFSAVRDLAAARYPWEQLLSQLSGLMPAKAALTSMQASTASTTAPSSSTSSSTASSSTGTPAAAASAPLPSVQLSGCAASQSKVADTMVQLHKIQGVSAVLLSSSANTSTANGGNSSSSGSSGAQGGCPFPVAFQVSLTFSAPAAATSAASATPAAATSAAPATSADPAATPATATSTPSTGAAQ